jgi:ABC-2 type transport system ATP-binding protein
VAIAKRIEQERNGMIKVQEVTKNYDATRALESVSFEVKQGEIVGLLGPNGAGKTSLIKILCGYFEPTGGEVTIDGVDVAEDPLSTRRNLGYLPENAPLYPEMVVQEYLWMMAELRNVPLDRRKAALERAVRDTGLSSVLLRPIGQLSKGFRQRVGLAQAILHEPKILILDEPTSGLDPSQIAEFRHLIRRLAADRKTTVVISTHILSEVEQTCERVLLLINGKLRADSDLKALTTTNQARVSFARGVDAEAILKTLAGKKGVSRADLLQRDDQAVTLRVDGEQGVDLGELVYECAREHGWPLRELARNIRTLESVFRELSSGLEGQAS